MYMTIAFSSPLLTYHSHFSVPDSPRRRRNGRVLRSGTTQTPRRSNRLRASKPSEVEDLAASVPTDSPRIAGRSKLKRRAPGKSKARKLEKTSGHIPRTLSASRRDIAEGETEWRLNGSSRNREGPVLGFSALMYDRSDQDICAQFSLLL